MLKGEINKAPSFSINLLNSNTALSSQNMSNSSHIVQSTQLSQKITSMYINSAITINMYKKEEENEEFKDILNLKK